MFVGGRPPPPPFPAQSLKIAGIKKGCWGRARRQSPICDMAAAGLISCCTTLFYALPLRVQGESEKMSFQIFLVWPKNNCAFVRYQTSEIRPYLDANLQN
jgi:hypothetical protein